MARKFVLITDSGTDLPREYYEEHDLPFLSIEYTIEGQTYPDDAWKSMTHRQFYDMLRKGSVCTTNMVNTAKYLEVFEKYLRDGKDIYYIAFSSGLSGSCNCGMSAAAELREKYPERKIIVSDSLCASMGQGLLLHYVIKRADAGESIEEIYDWVEENKKHVNHLVTVDSLFHLHRGGRVSMSSAIVGSLVGIKPMIHMNIEGKLIPVEKTRGRKAALNRLVAWMEERLDGRELEAIGVSHSDCEEEALWVRDELVNKFKPKESLVSYIGPVIGGHTGPGTIAIFFLGKPRYK